MKNFSKRPHIIIIKFSNHVAPNQKILKLELASKNDFFAPASEYQNLLTAVYRSKFVAFERF